MSNDTPTQRQREDSAVRRVYAPEGHAWVAGHGRSPGMWDPIEETVHQATQGGATVRYPTASEDSSEAPQVHVPADEPAMLADVMQLASDVVSLREQIHVIKPRLEGAGAVLSVDLDGRREHGAGSEPSPC